MHNDFLLVSVYNVSDMHFFSHSSLNISVHVVKLSYVHLLLMGYLLDNFQLSKQWGFARCNILLFGNV